MNKQEAGTFNEYEKELRKAEKKVAGEIDPGARALVVAVGVLVAMVSLVLPHAGEATGLDVLTMSSKAQAEAIKLPSTIFVYLLVIFAIGFSGLALVTRRWVLALVALAGTCISSVAGLLAVWTRNTVGVHDIDTPTGAGIGLYLGWFVAMALVFHWGRVVWNRSTYHLQVAEDRRAEAARREAFGMSLQHPVAPKSAPASGADAEKSDEDQTPGETPEA
ncbi:hypothetical protein [Gordonia phthalatica]|uniref:Transmembrane protein n=1 Tax=Gordonia phthalatica TaxID=1136941 RepID=A0A0N9NAW9_9ACTN|nr:hypothetical protein [Gordonia phthalatica]ALG84619.1 hypothetical protein ACH46_09075 [Gordonia phthalatica]